MKKKNLISLLAFALLILASVSLTSCGGDEEDDPKPTKTELEQVQEAIDGSVWSLLDASVDFDNALYAYTGGSCDYSEFIDVPAQVKLNIIDFKYSFIGTSLSYEPMNLDCGWQTGTYNYTVEKIGEKYVVSYKHGNSSTLKFEIQNEVEDMEDSEISVKLLTLYGGATETTLTFKRN